MPWWSAKKEEPDVEDYASPMKVKVLSLMSAKALETLIQNHLNNGYIVELQQLTDRVESYSTLNWSVYSGVIIFKKK